MNSFSIPKYLFSLKNPGYMYIGRIKKETRKSTMEHSLVWNKNKLNLVQEMLSEYVDDQTILANLPI